MNQIPLTQGKFALVDDEDFAELNKHKWYAHKLSGIFYADRHGKQSSGKRFSVLMHRVILGLVVGDGKQVDHINHDGLDNRKSNLRVCNVQQNQYNKKNQTNGTSPYKGVYQKTGWRRWKSTIHHNGKCIHLGHHDTQEEAARAYNAKACELFGDFARLNEVA